MWEFAFNFRKTRTSRRPDLRLDDKEKEILGICDMVYPQENNIVTRRDVKQKIIDRSRPNWENREQCKRDMLYL